MKSFAQYQMFSYIYTDQYSTECSRGTLYISLELYLCASLSCPVFSPVSWRYLGCPQILNSISLAQRVFRALFGFSLPPLVPWNFLNAVCWDNGRDRWFWFLMSSNKSGLIIVHCLMFTVLNLMFYIFCPFFFLVRG